MSEEKLPGWIRFLDIIIGLIAVIIAAVVIYSLFVPGFLAQEIIIYLFGVLLIIYGIYMMIRSFVAKGWTMGFRALYFVVGVLFLIFGALAFVFTLLYLALVVIFFGIAVLMYGILLIVVGFGTSEMKGWVRGLVVIIGFILLIAGIIFIFYWATAGTVWWLIVLALALLIEGIGRLIVGITGESY